jgi:hypothetical protein
MRYLAAESIAVSYIESIPTCLFARRTVSRHRAQRKFRVAMIPTFRFVSNQTNKQSTQLVALPGYLRRPF